MPLEIPHLNPWKARPLLRIRYGKACSRSAFAELRYGPEGEYCV
jgi:hypothetical protein